jgi:DNA-binding transcriptional MerR regulator
VPTLLDYAKYAPYTIDQLVTNANSVLRERPRLQVSKRTVRYYISEGVLPAPHGSPKFARYGMEHFVMLVGARCLQDQGMRLEVCKKTLAMMLSRGQEHAMKEVQAMVDTSSPSGAEEGRMVNEPSGYAREELPIHMHREKPPRPSMRLRAQPETVRRVPLDFGLVLETPADEPLEESLRRARYALEQILHDIT